MKAVSELDERELLALAISAEEEDGRVYLDFAEGLRDKYPDSAKVFVDMAAEENEHRRSLIDIFAQRFGPHIPLVRTSGAGCSAARTGRSVRKVWTRSGPRRDEWSRSPGTSISRPPAGRATPPSASCWGT